MMLRHKQTAAFNCKFKRHAANLPSVISVIKFIPMEWRTLRFRCRGKLGHISPCRSQTQHNNSVLQERLTGKRPHITFFLCHQQKTSRLQILSFEFAGIAEGQASGREHCVTEVPHLVLGPFGSHNRNMGLVSNELLPTLVLNTDVLERQSAMCR